MNWRGKALLIALALTVVGFFGWRYASEQLVERRYRGYADQIYSAVRGKFEVTDIALTKTTGAGDILTIYLHTVGTTAQPLTDEEFEVVDALFTNIVVAEAPDYVVWVWVRPGSAGSDIWYMVVITACRAPSVMAKVDNPSARADCETQQIFQPLEAKHLRFLKEETK